MKKQYCIQCGRTYIPKAPHQYHCSTECKLKYRRKRDLEAKRNKKRLEAINQVKDPHTTTRQKRVNDANGEPSEILPDDISAMKFDPKAVPKIRDEEEIRQSFEDNTLFPKWEKELQYDRDYRKKCLIENYNAPETYKTKPKWKANRRAKRRIHLAYT